MYQSKTHELGIYDPRQAADIVSKEQKAFVDPRRLDYVVGDHLTYQRKRRSRVIADIKEVRHVPIHALTPLELEQCGFTGVTPRAALIERMGPYCCGANPDSLVTFVRWDNVRVDASKPTSVAAQLQLGLDSASRVTANLNKVFRK